MLWIIGFGCSLCLLQLRSVLDETTSTLQCEIQDGVAPLLADPDMQKDNFLHEQGLSQIILPEKVRKLQQKWICNKTA